MASLLGWLLLVTGPTICPLKLKSPLDSPSSYHSGRESSLSGLSTSLQCFWPFRCGGSAHTCSQGQGWFDQLQGHDADAHIKPGTWNTMPTQARECRYCICGHWNLLWCQQAWQHLDTCSPGVQCPLLLRKRGVFRKRLQWESARPSPLTMWPRASYWASLGFFYLKYGAKKNAFHLTNTYIVLAVCQTSFYLFYIQQLI